MADSKVTGKRSARTGGKKPGTQAAAIYDHLCQSDTKLAKMIEQVGPYTLTVNEIQSSFEALAESIVYQQITGKAAQSICQKVMKNFATETFPGPQLLLGADIEELRSCGLSRAKAMALQDLSEKYLEGVVPSIDEMHQTSDEDLISRLTSVRGIGPWTVQMLLIFRLGRLDVLPSTDYGVRKGYALTFYGKKRAATELPTPSEIEARAERWRPFRSAASWYLWRALEVEKRMLSLLLIAVSLVVATSAALPVDARPNAYDYDPRADEEDDAPVRRPTASAPARGARESIDRSPRSARGDGRGYAESDEDDSDDRNSRNNRNSRNDGYDRNENNEGTDRRPSTRKPPKLSVPAYVTYWTHDALGYHPSMALTIENISESNLLGETIQLQAHFRLVSEGILTVYRWQTRLDTIGGKQQTNTEAHGKRPFELPLDPNDWPMIECKIIAKIGDASSEDTQNLVVARIQPLAMSDEDARMQLNTQLGRNRLARAKQEQGKKKFEAEHPPIRDSLKKPVRGDQKPPSRPAASNGFNSHANPNLNSSNSSNSSSNNNNNNIAAPRIEKPLTAVANTLGGSFYVGNSKNSAGGTPATTLNPGTRSASSANAASNPPAKNASGGTSATATSAEQFLLKSNLPGLGDDFYHFEKALGMPLETDAKKADWIWATYKKQPQLKVVAGSKGRTGKADVVVCTMQQERALSDSQFVNCARALCGKFKSEKASATEHSVRYTGDGRVELTTLTTQSCRAVTFTSVDEGQKIVVVAVSRLPGNVSELLKDEGSRTQMLQFVLPGLGETRNTGRAEAPQRGRNDDDD
jgi:DNA-3-methyladenine glycosylase II